LLQQKRNRTYSLWKRTKDNETYNKLKALNSELRSSFTKVKAGLIKRKLYNRNPKQFWSAVNDSLGRNKKQNLEIVLNNKLKSNPENLAEIFKNTFVNKNEKNRPKIGPIPNDHSKAIPELMEFLEDQIEWTRDDVRKVLDNFTNKKLCET